MMNIFCSCFLSIQPSSDNHAWIFPRNLAFSGASGELTPPLSSGIDNLIQDQLIREFHVLLTTNGGWFSYRYVCDPIRGRVCPGVLLGKLGKKHSLSISIVVDVCVNVDIAVDKGVGIDVAVCSVDMKMDVDVGIDVSIDAGVNVGNWSSWEPF